MPQKILVTWGVLCCALTFFWSSPIWAAPQYQYQATKDLVRLVDNAAVLVREQGEDAFAAFEVPDSSWQRDGAYIFVCDRGGNQYVKIPEARGEKENINVLHDALQRPFGKMLLKRASDADGAGWVHYVSSPIEETPRLWRSVYVQQTEAPSGTVYIVGSGADDMTMEKRFVADMVDEAMRLVSEKGKDAFTVLRDPMSEFIYKDTYVFVLTINGFVIVNPSSQVPDGHNLVDMKEPGAKAFIIQYVNAALTKEAGWVEFARGVPGTKKRIKKIVHVRKTHFHGLTFIVGSGFLEK